MLHIGKWQTFWQSAWKCKDIEGYLIKRNLLGWHQNCLQGLITGPVIIWWKESSSAEGRDIATQTLDFMRLRGYHHQSIGWLTSRMHFRIWCKTLETQARHIIYTSQVFLCLTSCFKCTAICKHELCELHLWGRWRPLRKLPVPEEYVGLPNSWNVKMSIRCYNLQRLVLTNSLGCCCFSHELTLAAGIHVWLHNDHHMPKAQRNIVPWGPVNDQAQTFMWWGQRLWCLYHNWTYGHASCSSKSAEKKSQPTRGIACYLDVSVSFFSGLSCSTFSCRFIQLHKSYTN